MKHSLAFTYHFMIFLGMAILLTPAKLVSYKKEMNDLRIEKKQQVVAVENTAELMHGDIFFKY